MPTVLFAVPVLVLGAFFALAGRSNSQRALAALLTQAIASIAVASAVLPVLRGGSALSLAWSSSSPLGLVVFRVDALGAFFLVWSLPMTFLGTLYAVGYLRAHFDAGRNGGPHFALLNMVSLSFVVIYSVQDALVFLFGWEIAAVSAWLLVIWDYRSQKIRFAGFNYLVSTHVGLFVLVAAFMLLHSKTGSMSFDAFGAYLSTPGRTRGTVFALLGLSFALKSAFFPFHTWLPRAHSAAPAHVSALMSGVIHKAGLFGFLRFALLMGKPDEWMGWSVLGFGALSAVAGVLYTSAQRDLKRLLGYSSTENVGIAAIGFGVGLLGWAWGNPFLVVCGIGGGILHIFNHALFKCLLFYAAGAVYRAAHTIDLERLGGLLRRLPRTGVMFLLGGLAISALPPLNGFVSEFIIYSGLLVGGAPSALANASLVCAAAVLAFVGAVSTLSMTRAFGVAFLGTARDASLHVGDDPPLTMQWPMFLHAGGVLLVGLVPGAGLALSRGATALFQDQLSSLTEGTLLSTLEPVVWCCRLLAGLLLVTCLAGWRLGRNARRQATWGCGYTAPNSRMQYTASSFSAQFAKNFDSFLPEQRHEKLPTEVFPQAHGHIATHHVDAVERRMFEVLGQGESFIARAAGRIPEQPRFAFAAGLLALVVIVASLVGGLR